MRLLLSSRKTREEFEFLNGGGSALASDYDLDAAFRALVLPLESDARRKSLVKDKRRRTIDLYHKEDHGSWEEVEARRCLFIRLGERFGHGDLVTEVGMRTLSARHWNREGHRLSHAPYGHREGMELMPGWISHCRDVVAARANRLRMGQRDKHFIALGNFCIIILRRWKLWACRCAALRRALPRTQISLIEAFKRWRDWNRIQKLRELILRAAMRRWRERTLNDKADEHYRRRMLRHGLATCLRAWCVRKICLLAALAVRRSLGWGLSTLYGDGSKAELDFSPLLRNCFDRIKKYGQRHKGAELLSRVLRRGLLRRAFDKWLQAALLLILKDGRKRQGHCKCVYDVCKGGRCMCVPRVHLLRRIEELHRLVAHAMDRRDYRYLSHIAQYRVAQKVESPPREPAGAHHLQVEDPKPSIYERKEKKKRRRTRHSMTHW
jgi:hypothetical protein